MILHPFVNPPCLLSTTLPHCNHSPSLLHFLLNFTSISFIINFSCFCSNPVLVLECCAAVSRGGRRVSILHSISLLMLDEMILLIIVLFLCVFRDLETLLEFFKLWRLEFELLMKEMLILLLWPNLLRLLLLR